MLSPTTKILVASNELVNALKQPSPLFTTSSSSDHLAAIKNIDTIFEIAASSQPVPNKNNIPQPASVQLAPIHVPQPPTQKFTTYSTPVTPTPDPPDNADIPDPTTIPYNGSELSPPSPPMFNHHWPSTHRYPTQARNGTRHLVDCVLKEHTLNMCMAPEIVESAIRPLWSLQYSATHLSTTHCMYNVMNKETSEMQNYQKLLKQDSTREIWTLAMCKEMGTLYQGYKGLFEGTNTFFFMSHDEIRDIQTDKTVTYAHIVVDYRPKKDDPNHVRLTVRGNLLNVPGDLINTTADLTISKILWNSVLSTKYACFACIDIKNMYLQTPVTDYEYMRITRHLVPQEFIDEYVLESKIYKRFYIVRYKKVFMDCSKLVNSKTHF